MIEEGKLGNMAAIAAILEVNSASCGGGLFSSILTFSIDALSTEDWSICNGLSALLLDDTMGFNSPLEVCSSCKCFIIPCKRSFSLVSCNSS